MNTIKIELSLLPLETDEGMFQEIGTKVIIDGVRAYKGGYVELFEFFKDVTKKGVNSSPWLPEHKQTRNYFYNSKSRGTFMPFSCSCGAAGCAGIWDGILTKHRLTTVEWRAREEDGYKFLNSFYSFEKIITTLRWSRLGYNLLSGVRKMSKSSVGAAQSDLMLI